MLLSEKYERERCACVSELIKCHFETSDSLRIYIP